MDVCIAWGLLQILRQILTKTHTISTRKVQGRNAAFLPCVRLINRCSGWWWMTGSTYDWYMERAGPQMGYISDHMAKQRTWWETCCGKHQMIWMEHAMDSSRYPKHFLNTLSLKWESWCIITVCDQSLRGRTAWSRLLAVRSRDGNFSHSATPPPAPISTTILSSTALISVFGTDDTQAALSGSRGECPTVTHVSEHHTHTHQQGVHIDPPIERTKRICSNAPPVRYACSTTNSQFFDGLESITQCCPADHSRKARCSHVGTSESLANAYVSNASRLSDWQNMATRGTGGAAGAGMSKDAYEEFVSKFVGPDTWSAPCQCKNQSDSHPQEKAWRPTATPTPRFPVPSRESVSHRGMDWLGIFRMQCWRRQVQMGRSRWCFWGHQGEGGEGQSTNEWKARSK